MPLRSVAPLLLLAGITVAQVTPVPDVRVSAASMAWRLALHSTH